MHSLKPTLDAPRKSAEIRKGNEKVFQPSIQVSGGVLLRVSEMVNWSVGSNHSQALCLDCTALSVDVAAVQNKDCEWEYDQLFYSDQTRLAKTNGFQATFHGSMFINNFPWKLTQTPQTCWLEDQMSFENGPFLGDMLDFDLDGLNPFLARRILIFLKWWRRQPVKFLDVFVASKVLVFFWKRSSQHQQGGKSSISSLVAVKNQVCFDNRGLKKS